MIEYPEEMHTPATAKDKEMTRRSTIKPKNYIYKSGEVADILGISRKTFSYWERIGLIRWDFEKEDRRGKHREYWSNTIEELKTWVKQRDEARKKYGL